MNRRRWFTSAAVVLILVLALVGAFVFLPVSRVHQARLARLVTTQAPAGFKAKATTSQVVAPSSSPYAVVKTAAKRSPHTTGSYSIGWAGSASANDTASMLATMLPSGADAATAETQAKSGYVTAKAYTAESYAFQSSFPVPGVPGATTGLYLPTAKTVTQALAVVTFRVDRVVVLALVRRVGTATTQSSAVALTQAEYRHVAPLAGGFSVVETHWPAVATAIYAAVAAVLIALVLAVPVLVERVRRRRRLAHQAAERRQVLTRGGKIARRQASHRR